MVKLRREQYEKNGYKNYSYYVSGSVKGREVKAKFVAPDRGGYQILDIIFDGKDEVDLKVTPFEMKTEDGKLIKGNTFSASTVDENGQVVELKVKPYKPSDKTIINMIIAK